MRWRTAACGPSSATAWASASKRHLQPASLPLLPGPQRLRAHLLDLHRVSTSSKQQHCACPSLHPSATRGCICAPCTKPARLRRHASDLCVFRRRLRCVYRQTCARRTCCLRRCRARKPPPPPTCSAARARCARRATCTGDPFSPMIRSLSLAWEPLVGRQAPSSRRRRRQGRRRPFGVYQLLLVSHKALC